MSWLTNPVTALLINMGGMYLLYLTPLYRLTLENAWLHGLIHIHFALAGFLFTWSIIGIEPVKHRPGKGVCLFVLFFAVGLHGTLAKLMYAYGWPAGTPYSLSDIQSAAKLMYYAGDLSELLLIIVFFSIWFRKCLKSPHAGVYCMPEIG